ncbi:exodeoxyribonuclease VII large subunit [Nesterenkonia sp. YGD6]|uniref:exodeoxyribonuclease VII large subunit n=1 Tax=Nesterenkonia sp. YGD6 TaxID=2901231 RepID=UPI001F4C6AAB|nr:exodeoxyribonuclease VII large subunit [Nesterenkonia sp. YGD6]MCH8563859.1 exodeoxyribonuclease VII large subunit [Nesterenkonia sp. YGD6]
MSEPAQAQDTSAETPWALSTYSGKLKAHIEAAPPTWVEGQLVEFNLRNGNAWMTLRDLEQEVSFSTVAWRTVAGNLSGTVQPGSRVVALVKPNLYEKSGRLSLVAQQMKPVGLGDLLARIEQLRQRLAAEGLFRLDRKKPLPVLPLRIGLITGRNSDAKKDILRNTHARWAAAQFEIREVATQGPGAPQEVAAALAELDADPAVEVIVIARGGGALEEVVLPFSDERLIRAVAAAHTPVVSAIGHEADRPLLDEVADMRASTPTGAAKLLVVDEAQERDQLTHARERMSAGVQRLIGRETEWLQALRSRPVLAQPQDMITGRAQELLMLRRRSLFGMETALRRDTDWVAQTRARVRSLSPQSTLDRGYAVVQTQGGAGWDVLRDAGTVAVGDRLSIMVASGELTARAEEIFPRDRRAAQAEHDAQIQNREAAQ